MDREKMIRHWSTFCSIADMFEQTQKYTYHGIRKNKKSGKMVLIHENVYSEIFREILILTCAEFEIVGKNICKHLDSNRNANNIVDISEMILDHYPHIKELQVQSLYWTCDPFSDWQIVTTGKGQKVEGLDWWKAYNSIKHDETDSFSKATLENALSALASLYIFNMYAMRIVDGNLNLMKAFPPKYFIYDLYKYGGELPDFV